MYDNWVRGSAEVRIEQGADGNVPRQMRRRVANDGVARFHESLRALLDDLTGTARLATIEDQVEVTIELKAGKGALKGRVEAHAIAALEFEASTDQSFLAVTLDALRAVVAKWPYRG